MLTNFKPTYIRHLQGVTSFSYEWSADTIIGNGGTITFNRDTVVKNLFLLGTTASYFYLFATNALTNVNITNSVTWSSSISVLMSGVNPTDGNLSTFHFIVLDVYFNFGPACRVSVNISSPAYYSGFQYGRFTNYGFFDYFPQPLSFLTLFRTATVISSLECINYLVHKCS